MHVAAAVCGPIRQHGYIRFPSQPLCYYCTDRLQPEIRLVYFDVVNPQDTGGVLMIDKTTPRLIQFHTLKNAVNPPFLGGFLISGTVAA